VPNAADSAIPLYLAKKCQLMWGKLYVCVICGTKVASAMDVFDHIKGHDRVLHIRFGFGLLAHPKAKRDRVGVAIVKLGSPIKSPPVNKTSVRDVRDRDGEEKKDEELKDDAPKDEELKDDAPKDEELKAEDEELKDDAPKAEKQKGKKDNQATKKIPLKQQKKPDPNDSVDEEMDDDPPENPQSKLVSHLQVAQLCV
jgi:hypothetical protein